MNLAISLDFETLSLKENATLLALGAVAIDTATGDIASEFYAAIDPRQQPGRDIDPSTVLWWLTQDKAAQNKLTEACADADTLAKADESVTDEQMTELYASAAHRIDHVAQAFVAWHAAVAKLADTTPDKLEVWSNGAVDHGWLDNMMAYSGLKNPVPYYRQRDYRTIKALFPAVEADELDGFIAHHALWDAKKQAKHLVKLLEHARRAEYPTLRSGAWPEGQLEAFEASVLRNNENATALAECRIERVERVVDYALYDELAAHLDGQNAEQSSAETLHG